MLTFGEEAGHADRRARAGRREGVAEAGRQGEERRAEGPAPGRRSGGEGRQTRDIQQVLGRSRGFVQRWVYAYRDTRASPPSPPCPAVAARRGSAVSSATAWPPGLRPAPPRPTASAPSAARTCGASCGRNWARTSRSQRSAARCTRWATAASARGRGTRTTIRRPSNASGSWPPFCKVGPGGPRPYGVVVRTFFMDEARFDQQGTITRV